MLRTEIWLERIFQLIKPGGGGGGGGLGMWYLRLLCFLPVKVKRLLFVVELSCAEPGPEGPPAPHTDWVFIIL